MSEKPVCLNNEHIGGRINIADAIGLKLFSASQRARTLLLRGGPGTGKSTLALQLASQAAADGSVSVYVTVYEPVESIVQRGPPVATGRF